MVTKSPMKNLITKEKKISLFFDGDSRSVNLDADPKPLMWTAQEHVSFCKGSPTLVDVGSGSGRLILEMLENGVEKAVGIDLSLQTNEIARQRMKKANIDDSRYLFLDGSFLEMDSTKYPNIEDEYDSVSLHLVLCCHPDREGLLNQAAKLKPSKIVVTVPRSWFLLRLLVGVWGIFSRIRTSFRPYIHAQSSIDNQMISLGYKLDSRVKGRGLVVNKYVSDV